MNVTELKEKWQDRITLPITIGNGWADLVDDMITEMVAVDPNVRLDQIKEKFGALRVYYKGEPMNQLVNVVTKANIRAKNTCDFCGTIQGVTLFIEDSWHRTRCANHKSSR